MIPRISIPVTLVATLMTPGPIPVAAAQAADCGFETRTVELRGATFHYIECGEGQPLVFVHGGLGDLHTFDPQLEAFAVEYRVISYSRRFHPPNDFEEGMRRFVDGICGPGCFDQLTPPQRANMMKYAPELGLEMLTDRSAYLPSLACGALGGLERPVLLVTGERSLPELFLVTAELEACLNGEAHVMIPETDHNVMGNVAFYNRSVLAFLRDQPGR